MIHDTAIVDEGSVLGEDLVVGPYAVVEAGVTLGDRCELDSHAVVKRGTRLGEDCYIGPFAVVGGHPQVSDFDRSIESGVVVGQGSVLREHVTVHRSALDGGVTSIGERSLLMASCHLGHDSKVGHDVTIANGVLLAGHVVLEDHVFVGGGAAFHQFVRVGESAMVGGAAVVSLDVPPYVMVAERNMACGPNLIGLRRRSLSKPAIAEIKSLYKKLFMDGSNPRAAAHKVLQEINEVKTEEGRRFLRFFEESERGFVRSRSRGDSNVSEGCDL